jgi:HSP20 family protein
MTSLVRNNSLQPWKGFFDSDDFFTGLWPSKMVANMPAVNVVENEMSFDLEVIAPGFKKEDFKINIEGGVLLVSGVSKSEEKEDKKDYKRREYNFSSFERSFQIPENVKSESISAIYENGILKLTLPKMETKVKTTKEIAVS